MRVVLFVLSCAVAFGAETPYFSDPALSPNRSEIAFVSGGDIWTVPASGGEARLLVSHPATESRPLYSPDGKKLAFVSTRTGNGDIYVLTLATGELKRITFDSGKEELDAWSRDGKWLYYTTSSRDISLMNDVYRVSSDGGTPMPVTDDRYTNESLAAPAPDGSTIAFTAHGTATMQWWRNGHSHMDESEIWLLKPGRRYERVTPGGAKEVWPMWSGDGRTLYYVSDRSGAQNIWSQTPGGKARQLTKFAVGRVVWPSISYDGREIVFERDFRVWKMDTESGKAAAVEIERRGAPASPAVDHQVLNQFHDLALSPDGKKVAFVAHGEVFAASAKDGGEAVRLTRSVEAESQLAWAPDSKRLIYSSERGGTQHIFLYDLTKNEETQLTRGATDDDHGRFSPDGKTIAFQRNGRELRQLDLQSKEEKLIAQGVLDKSLLGSDRPFVWSPDGKWLAYAALGSRLFRNLFVVPAAGGEPKQVSFLSNAYGETVSWSPDGKYLLYDTTQRTENGQVARVDLVPRTPRFREDQFRDLFKDDKPKAGESKETKAEPGKGPAAATKIVLEDIRSRLTVVPTGLDVKSQEISPDGKWLLLNASAGGVQQNLYIYPLDELAKDPPVAKQLTSTAGRKSDAQFSPDGKEVYFIEQGRIQMVNVESRVVKPIVVTASIDVDFAREKVEMFRQAWTYLRDYFYDPKYHGADWNAVRARYQPVIEGAGTYDEVRRLISLMVGELNASHLGISGPNSPEDGSGRLGLRFDSGAYEQNGKLRVTEVIPLSPAAIAGIKPGDELLAVDGVATGPKVNLDELLAHKIGKRVALKTSASAEIAIRPVSAAAEKNLLYRSWVENNRAYVDKISGGKLGYVHMFDMGAGSLTQLYIDLDTENQSRDGVVIDIRNNTGGFVNAYALDVLARRGYLGMTVRDQPQAPGRSLLGQRSLELPTILVTNAHSLSDAEDFAEGYRALGLGKVVGQPTAGWIIYTSGAALIDGSRLRLPFTRITGKDGKDMELNPRPVDIAVKRPMGETYTGRDSQLDAAVKELLAEVGKK